MTWARILALIFVGSFAISALVSLFILDELSDVAQAARMPAPLLRHSVLPPLIKRGHKQQQRTMVKEEILPSRRPNRAPVKDAAHSSSTTGATDLPDSTLVHTDEEFSEDLSAFDQWSSTSGTTDEEEEESHHQHPEELPSLLFGGSASSLDSISLWTLMWKGIGVNLSEWNIDISHINHTFSVPSEQSVQRIAYQKLWSARSGELQSTPGNDASHMPPTQASEEAAAAALLAASMTASTFPAYRARTPPTVSVLHELKGQQGIAPFLSLNADCSLFRLTLVHSFFSRGPEDRLAQDVRGDGLIEWFVRPAAPLLYPLYSNPLAPVASAPSGVGASPPPQDVPKDDPNLGSTLANWLLSGDSLFSTFPDGSGRSPPIPGPGARRKLVEGDWALVEYARVQGIVHAQSCTNTAGNGGSQGEHDFTVVAFERLEPTITDDSRLASEPEKGETCIQVFFLPQDWPVQALSTASDSTDPSGAKASTAARPSLIIPLGTLRLVTAITITASPVHATSHSPSHGDQDGVVKAQIFYSLRGDRRVFRSLDITAVRSPSNEWILSHQPGAVGPLAERRGFISQTVALQVYQGEDDDDESESVDNETQQQNDSIPSSRSEYPSHTNQIIASELNWARGPVILAGPLAQGMLNRWQTHSSAGPSASGSVMGGGGSRAKHMQPQFQSTPPFSAAIYTPPHEYTEHNNEYERGSWITSTKTIGKYGADVHPLSIHRGNEGSLAPLVTAASANRRFVAFAQVPLITTVDGNANFEPIEIVHLEPDTVFTGLAFNQEGTILAVADNHQDIIILHRSLQAANQHRLERQLEKQREKDSANATTMQPLQQTKDGPVDTSTATTGDASSAPTVPSDAHLPTPSSDASPDPFANSASADSSSNAATSGPTPQQRKRHAWEVMMEVILPERIKHLTLISVQIIDVPVPSDPHETTPSAPPQWPIHLANEDVKDAVSSGAGGEGDIPASAGASPSAAESAAARSHGESSHASGAELHTPFLVMLFQGGVVGTMQLKAVGGSNPASAAPNNSGSSNFASSHFHHHHLPGQLNMAAFEGFMSVHWDLLLVLLCIFVWLIFSLPRFGRLAVQAQAGAQPAVQFPPGQQAAGAVFIPGQQPRGFFGQLVLGAGAVQLNQLQNNMAQQPQGNAAHRLAPNQAPGQHVAAGVAAPPPMSALNPLAAIQARQQSASASSSASSAAATSTSPATSSLTSVAPSAPSTSSSSTSSVPQSVDTEYHLP